MLTYLTRKYATRKRKSNLCWPWKRIFFFALITFLCVSSFNNKLQLFFITSDKEKRCLVSSPSLCFWKTVVKYKALELEKKTSMALKRQVLPSRELYQFRCCSFCFCRRRGWAARGESKNDIGAFVKIYEEYKKDQEYLAFKKNLDNLESS